MFTISQYISLLIRRSVISHKTPDGDVRVALLIYLSLRLGIAEMRRVHIKLAFFAVMITADAKCMTTT
jgi:hypothetical protein